MWFDTFCVAKRNHESGGVHSGLEAWCRVLYLAGANDQLNLEGSRMSRGGFPQSSERHRRLLKRATFLLKT